MYLYLCTAALQQMTDCIAEIRVWMAQRWLKLNEDKTEMVMFMSKYHLKQHGSSDITVGDATVAPVDCVRNLGVQMDQHLTMCQRVTAICRSCNYQLYRLSTIRRYLTMDAAINAVHALITSRLDYCNSLLAGLPDNQITRLQRIQNKAARLITYTPRRDHITPVLMHLHWLPVESRVKYKILVTAYKCMHGLAPPYLSELLISKKRDSRLRQTGAPTLFQPIAKKGIGNQSFGVAAPKQWNILPVTLRTAESLVSFKSHLKTYLFQEYFG